jgi:hypothetical protein
MMISCLSEDWWEQLFEKECFKGRKYKKKDGIISTLKCQRWDEGGERRRHDSLTFFLHTQQFLEVKWNETANQMKDWERGEKMLHKNERE